MDNILKLPKDKELLLVTHSGTFHADDVFASAVLKIVLEKAGYKYKIVRTREKEIIESADVVYDVGRVYDAEKLRFDHHQIDSTLQRDGIPYSSFGLIWKHFGLFLCENDEKLWSEIDNNLVKPIDCSDNGISSYDKKYDFNPITFSYLLFSYNPTRTEKEKGEEYIYELFFKAVHLAMEYLDRVVTIQKQLFLDSNAIIEIYNNTEDKRLIVLDKVYDYGEALRDKNEVLIVIKGEDTHFSAKAQRISDNSFETKIDFPKNWWGLQGEDLVKESGVKDAEFCHRGGFLCIAKSKEGAIELAKIALSKKPI